ncbi:hypothetical protein CC1G_08116 [Coprinopsis cinerea okayama7|uniref:Uncharacterized protein n=1 Tax=Coprinopsis cinerea (strain Okayama-7 / 130 / ATCC MYA-4618 / FGSC 9003) TaxID=240176 RepID=A8NVJ9_COPC7|nr:hypothetical protein CC1G_08116 [Coprinopsis cinerea okayama7\|eukprot:XP_001836731.1 hypothetical protein CC1G_08116 [Coprinopsis cinerea okayama7\
MPGAAGFMFVFATMEVVLTVRFGLQTVESTAGDLAPEQLAKIKATQEITNVLRPSCYLGQTIVGDAILLYRLWVVYNSNWRIAIFPTTMWLAFIVCGIMTICGQAIARNCPTAWIVGQLFNIGVTLLSLTLIMNVLTTGLIAYRIWTVYQKTSRNASLSLFKVDHPTPLGRILIVFIQSGLLYTTSVVVFFVLFVANHPAQVVMLNAIVQIIGITFNILIMNTDSSVSDGCSSTTGTRWSRHQIQFRHPTTEASIISLSLREDAYRNSDLMERGEKGSVTTMHMDSSMSFNNENLAIRWDSPTL